MPVRNQTRKEEVANVISHGAGMLFGLIAMPFLLAAAFDPHRPSIFVSTAVFGIGLFLVYTFSTLYHWEKDEKRKFHLKKCDHISIYFLIAGTYTPLVVRYLDNKLVAIILPIIWSIVLIGLVYKLFFINKLKWLSLTLYITMGWMLVFFIKPLLASVPTSVLAWILAGGLSYMAGVYFYVKSHKYYYHTIWHVFVLMGTIFHYVSIYKCVAVA